MASTSDTTDMDSKMSAVSVELCAADIERKACQYGWPMTAEKAEQVAQAGKLRIAAFYRSAQLTFDDAASFEASLHACRFQEPD